MRTKVALLLVCILLASGLIMLKPALPQISPAIPEFTVKLDDRSYDVVNATGTYHVEKQFVDVVIKNTGPLSFYAVVNDSIVKLYYNVRFKGHNQDWENATISPNMAPSVLNYTTVQFGVGSTNPDPGGFSIWLGNTTTSGKVDFQVLGVDGFYTKISDASPHCWRNSNFSVFNETGRSAWSDSQTISLDASTPNSSTDTPSNPNLILPATIIAAATIVILASALIYLTRHRKQSSPSKLGSI
jgi:hypothetical protein